MTDRRSHHLERILIERVRQFNLPGAERDMLNSPNDWTAIATHYLGEEVRRGGNLPDKDAFEDSLIKAAAVILAALEHLDVMSDKGHFR